MNQILKILINILIFFLFLLHSKKDVSDSTDQEQIEQEFQTENESVDYSAESHAETFIADSPSTDETLSET